MGHKTQAPIVSPIVSPKSCKGPKTLSCNIGAVTIRIGLRGPLYYIYSKEPLKQYWKLFRPLYLDLLTLGPIVCSAFSKLRRVDCEGKDKDKQLICLDH